MTPTEEDVEQLKKQNAMLMRALLKAKAANAELAQQLAALQPQAEATR
jgi:hypothetical protein